MRLVRFNEGRIGVLQGDTLHDATAAIGLDPAAWPPVGMIRLIRDFATVKPKLEQAARGAGIPVANVRLLAPIVWPHNLFAYPVNYIAHQTEMASTHRADLNGYFLKATSSISGPQDPIVLPDLPSHEIHHECELALIIGKGGRHIPVEAARDHIFGYSCLMDITVRGKEERVMRNSYDTFTPIGPALVTADEVGDPSDLDMKLWVNDTLRQHASTRDLIVDIPNMVALASSVSTLEPGDVIATGTPEGVGPIRGGDTVTIEIALVGRMAVPVKQGSGGWNLAIRKEDRP
ncbi:MAG TPA: fumarylacetoacetate hydrolase family protein [Xanthobacteraceae bacterium]|nr:fumarylacetoacetate hydrolase family protein [Xanthobacteraceae bacterium]